MIIWRFVQSEEPTASSVKLPVGTCGCEPPPAHSAGPGPLAVPPGSAGSWRLLNPTAPGETPGWTARWFGLAAAGWTCRGCRRLPPAAKEWMIHLDWSCRQRANVFFFVYFCHLIAQNCIILPCKGKQTIHSFILNKWKWACTLALAISMCTRRAASSSSSL